MKRNKSDDEDGKTKDHKGTESTKLEAWHHHGDQPEILGTPVVTYFIGHWVIDIGIIHITLWRCQNSY